MSFLRSLGLGLVAAYSAFFIFAALMHDRLIFPAPPSSYDGDDDLVTLTTSDGVRIKALYRPVAGARYTVLYSHGNGEDLGTIRPALEALRDLGLSVLAYDYRGYGLSEGVATAEGVLEDIDAAYRYLVEEIGVPAGRIIVYGRSVGGGPSLPLAAREPVAGVVLESTFVSAFTVVTRVPLLPFDRFRGIDFVDQVDCPVLVIHSSGDWTVPFSHGERLYRAAREPKMKLWLEEVGHNDLLSAARPLYDGVMREFIELIDAPRRGSLLPT